MEREVIYFGRYDLAARYKIKRNPRVLLQWLSEGKLPAGDTRVSKNFPLWRITDIEEWESKHARTLREFRKLLRMPLKMFKKARKLLANSEGVSK